MNKEEKDLVQKLGEIISVEKICNSNIKNVLEGEFNYNKKNIKVYVIGGSLHIEKKKIEVKIVGIIELKDSDEKRIVAVEKENNNIKSYSQITGVFYNVYELKKQNLNAYMRNQQELLFIY